MKKEDSVLLARRVRTMAPSMTLAMTARARLMRKNGHDVINLSIGEPDFQTPVEVASAACAAIQSGQYGFYPPVAGYDDVRALIAEKFRRENGLKNAKSEEIVVSSGAKQSIMNVVLSLVNPGDEVVLFAPYWVSYPAMVEFAGGKVISAKSALSDNYKPSARALARAISPKTRLVIFSTPSNPAGSVFSYDELKDMAYVLAKHPRVFILSDEIYEKINFTGNHTSIGSFPQVANRTITVNGLSKGYAMTGWRIGYLHAPLDIARACEKIQGQFTSGANGIAQRTVLTTLSGKADQASATMCKTYQKRRDLMLKAVKRIPGIKTYTPEGAFYLFPDVSAYLGRHYKGVCMKDVNALCMYLLEEAHVSTVSGLAFGDSKAIRLSYAASETMLLEAIARIQKALAALD